mmetsp:Transcript_13967/g.15910  ORF Transcript_13967/g.15910 Transcript_13967/m.15910 type:complete len:162 (+) Transcript_13967:103-588(+)
MLATTARRALVKCARTESKVFSVQVNKFSSGSSSEGFLEKQERLGRPVSPHVLIYSFPVAAISSITHRVTGGLLSVGLYGAGAASLLGADVASLASTLGSSSIGPLVKLSVAFPLIFHSAAGIRHFYWEKAPEGLNVESQRQMSLVIFGVSGLASLGLMFV